MYDIFSIPNFEFPKDFVWGTATAGHQIEGNNTNNNRYLEELERPVNEIFKPSGMACNHYHMVDEDISLMKELELPAYRMSIEWSRIEPTEGQFNDEAINHYLHEITKCKENGIKVYLTIHHFTHPIWFDELGGFLKLDNRKYLERFLEKVVPLYAPYVDNWNVFNEFNIGREPEVKLAILRYHALGYHIIKKYSSAPVSTAHALVLYEPMRRYDRFDNAVGQIADCSINEFFFHAIRTGEAVLPMADGFYDKDLKNTCDYWAINIYTRCMMDGRKKDFYGQRYAHKYLRFIDMDFYLDELFPETMIHQLSRLKDKPVVITENGLACKDDDWRIAYLVLYLSALNDAIKMGVDVRGYFYWSFMDNYEWTSFLPRFGLVDVDFETFKRTPKRSAYFYRDMINNNGFSQEILKKYLEKLPTLNDKK